MNVTKKTLLTACLLGLQLAWLSAQTVVQGYAINATDLNAERLPNGDLLLNSITQGIPGTGLVWAQIDTAGTVVQEHGLSFGQFMEVNASTVLVDGRGLIGGMMDLGSYIAPYTIVRDSAGASDAHVFDTPNFGEFLGLVAMPDSGYIGLGYRNTPDFRYLAAAVRVDKAGDTLWTRAYDPGSGTFVWYTGVATPDGGILVAGYHAALNADRGDLVIASMAKGGNLNWLHRLPGDRSIAALKMVQGPDKHLYLAVLATDTVTGKETPGVVSLDTLGNVRWGTLLGGYPSATTHGITIGAGGMPIVYGDYDAAQQANFVGYTATLDSAGAIQSSAGYATQGFGGVKAAFLAAGDKPTVVLADDVAVMTTKLLRTNAYGVLEPSACGAVQPLFVPLPLTFSTSTLSLVQVHGFGSSYHGGVFNQPVIPSSIECVATGTEAPRLQATAQVVPQPLRAEGRLTLAGEALTEDRHLVVTDMQGRQVALSAEAVADGFVLNRSALAAGLYSYQVLQAGQRIASGKLWIAD
jgi:hypothetical protein